jgi:hypothetical protein
MKVSSITHRQHNRRRYSVHVLDSIGNQLILTAYASLGRCPRELYQCVLDANGLIIKRILVSTTWVGEIAVSNPTYDYRVVTVTAEHEAKK